jgi:glycosyl-4,4'-diaponeurosporenoate acyltransferase
MGVLGLTGSWLIALNFCAWFLIQVGAGYVASRLPARAFATDGILYRERGWEAGGRLYKRVLRVERWKRFLPDGARAFRSGFAKGHLRGTSPDYLALFVAETRRAELVHWLAMGALPVFALWSDWQPFLLMGLYALAANVPCLLTQRYNRFRLQRVLARMQRRDPADRRRGRSTGGGTAAARAVVGRQ